MIADKKSKPGSVRPELVPNDRIAIEVVLLDGIILERNLAVLGERQTHNCSVFDSEFAGARRQPKNFDRRRVKDRDVALKAEALGRGWWVPKGLNEEWLLNKGWKDYYEKKRSGARAPQSVTELIQMDVDQRLIALARNWGIETPLASQLTDEWRLDLRNKLQARVAEAAKRMVDDAIFTPRPPQRRGKTPGAWNKNPPKSQDKATVKRRERRQAKTKY